MRKLLLVALLAVSGMVLAACGLFDDDPEEVETTTIEFYNSEGWETVYAYAEDRDGNELLGPMPGEEAVQHEEREDWWSVEVPVENVLNDPVDITFNDGDEEEAGTTTVNHPDYVFVTIEAGETYGTRDSAEFAMRDVEDTRVYFYNSEGWYDVRVWAWDDERDFFSSWPGVEAEAAEEDDWYYYDVPADINEQEFEIIFNGLPEEDADSDDREQTDDIPITEPGMVYLTVENTVSDSFEAAYDALEQARAQTTVYFYNSEGWDNVQADVTSTHMDEDHTLVAEDEGDGWFYVDVPFAFPEEENGDENDVYFDITFHDGDDNEAATQTIVDDGFLYVTVDSIYNHMDAAEAWTDTDEEDLTRIYFYNVHGWEELSAYIWSEEPGEVLGAWPGMEASHDEGDWYYVDVPMDLNEHETDVFIFNGIDPEIEDEDEQGVQTGDIALDDPDYVYLAIDDNAYSSKEDAEAATEDALAGTTVHFYNSEGWDDVYATATGEDLEEDFEDVAATEGEDGWYSVDVPLVIDEELSFDIVFHDGDEAEAESQTVQMASDFTFQYVTMDDIFIDQTWAVTMTDAEENLVEFYFYNSEEWTDVHLHSWGSEDFGGWPGVHMEQVDETDWYSVTIPVDFAETNDEDWGIMFTSAFDGEQTDDMNYVDQDHVYYTMDDVFESKEDAEASLED